MAAGTMLLLALVQLASVAFARPLPGTTAWWSYANSAVLAAVLVIGAGLVIAGSNKPAWSLEGWMGGLIAAGYVIVHGLMMRASGNWAVLVEVPIGIGIGFLVREAFKREPAAPLTWPFHGLHLRRVARR